MVTQISEEQRTGGECRNHFKEEIPHGCSYQKQQREIGGQCEKTIRLKLLRRVSAYQAVNVKVVCPTVPI